MPADNSDCLQYFGYKDFEVGPAKLQGPFMCPIKTCSTKTVRISYGKSTKQFCPTHGIRLLSNTFVYWNGEKRKDDARLRNFRILPELARKIALRSGGKAESHRLAWLIHQRLKS